MKRTTANGSSSGLFVDIDETAGDSGTEVTAEDMNNHQEELCSPIEGVGLTLNGDDQMQLEKAIIGYSHRIGEMLWLSAPDTPVIYSAARSSTHTAYPEYFPACPRYDADHDITTDMVGADVVAYFRAIAASFVDVSSWTVTVSGSVVTFTESTSADALLAALVADANCSNWFNLGQTADSAASTDFTTTTTQRCINISGTDYAITAVSTSARTITVSGSPTAGAAILYPYRIAGSSTSFRLHRIAGMVQAAAGDADGQYSAGLRVMGRIQGHKHAASAPAGGGGAYAAAGTYYAETAASGVPVTDTYDGTPRTGKTTDARSIGGYPFTWLRNLVATLA